MRDRLEHFQQLLQVTQNDTNANDRLIDDDLFAFDGQFKGSNSFDDEMEKFLIRADIIQQRLRSSQQLIHELRRKQSQIIVETSSDNQLEEDLDCLMKRIKDLTTAIDQEIKDLSLSYKEDRPWSIEHRIRKCQVAALQKVFQEVMFDYNKSQIDHRDNCKNRIVRQLEIAGSRKSEEEVEGMLENKDFAVFTSNILLETQHMKLALKVVESRHSDIIRLEKSLYEIQDLFIEMARVIESQGHLIDNIQHNVELADEYLQVTVPALRAAKRYRRRRFLFCCPCLNLCNVC